MGDWHYTPNPDGPTQELLATLTNLDCESLLLIMRLAADGKDHAILEYKMDDLKEEFTIPASPEPGKQPDPELSHRSLLDLQPMAIFSERRLPLVYNFKLSQATALTDYQDPYTGEIKQRYHNTARQVGFAPIVIGHLHPLGEVPQEPEAKVKTRMQKLDQELLGRIRQVCYAPGPIIIKTRDILIDIVV
jgi:general transcription factor 3C polypeptide 5 (transcription factor C subunit 1)